MVRRPIKAACSFAALAAAASIVAPSRPNAQQSLPTIDVGGVRQKSKVRGQPHQPSEMASPSPTRVDDATRPIERPLIVGGPATVVNGYVPLKTTAGTKTATPILEIPQSITVVTRQQLDDRNVQTLSQALDYTSSVRTGAFGFDPRFDSFYLRGFDMTYTGIYRDGLRQPAATFGIYKTEPYGLESIVVVKGPSSALYGLGSPGGLIDLQSKRPTLEPLREVQVQLGSYNRYQGNFDFGGALDQNGVYSYRLTGLFRDSNTWLPGVKDNRYFVAPAFAYRPDDSTSLTFLGEYMNSRTTGNSAFYQTPEGVLTRFYQGDPRFTNFDQDQFRIGYEFEHKFNENITFKQNVRFAHLVADVRYTQIDFIDFDTGIASRSTGRIVDHLSAFGVDNQVHAKFATGPIDHAALAGLEYTYAQFNDKYGFGLAPDLPIYPSLPYGFLPINPPDLYSFVESQKQDQLAMYVQDHAKLGPVNLTLSGREDWVYTKTNTETAAATDDGAPYTAYAESRQRDRATTWRAGAIYVSPFGLAPFANYATGFAPTLGTDANGTPFKPVTGEQKEFGVKFQPPGWNALLTASWFDIRQSHILVQDPNNLAFQTQTGAVRSRGFEFEGVASVGPGLSASVSYTNLSLKYVSGDPTTIGRTPSGIPQQTFAAWADYTIQPGHAFAGLGAGFGVRYVGATFGDEPNTFKSPSATTLDGSLHYDLGQIDPAMKGVRLQINGQNLADAVYQTCQGGFCYFGPRRTIIGSLRYRW